MKLSAMALAGFLAATTGVATPAWADGNVVTYHNDVGRSGMFVAPGMTPSVAATMARDPKFNGSIPGQIQSQQLYFKLPGSGRAVILATASQNVVEAMDATTGVALWQTNLGPVPKPQGGTCSTGLNVGVLGTPVIDPVKAIVYVTTFMIWQGVDQYMVFALSMVDGSIQSGWPVNLQAGASALGYNFLPVVQGQRSALTLVNGTLYIPFASNSGECNNFRGWVFGVDVARAAVSGVWTTRAVKGGIWGQGGVVSDGTSLFTSTGNTYLTNVWRDGEAVIRLQPNLQRTNVPADYFTPSNWLQLDKDDMDMSSTAPLVLDVPRLDGSGVARWILQFGKDGVVYMLDRANLGGIGGALYRTQVAYPEIRASPVWYPAPDGLYVAFTGTGSSCPGRYAVTGLIVLKVQALPDPKVSTVWCASVFAEGSPIVTTTDGTSNPIVWLVGGQGDGFLHAYDGVTGTVLFDGGGEHLGGVRQWATPIYAQGRIYVGGNGRVFSFKPSAP